MSDAQTPIPIERACYWLASLGDAEVGSPLESSLEADVAIVGGGFTGLWTALCLKELEPSTNVVLLEAERIAYGASGRNAGIVGETFDHSHGLAVRHFGLAEARQLAQLARANLDEMERFLVETGIDAEFERTGQLFVALEPHHEQELDAALDAARTVGIEDWRRLDRDETRIELASPLYRGGLVSPRAATVHPAKLALGLGREAARRGVTIHERTPVTSWRRDGAGIRLATPHGAVRARRAILATNAYTHHLAPTVGRRFLPLYDYVLASAPLSDTQWEALGWRNRRGVTDGRTFFNYYRPTRDRRIVWGTSEARYFAGDRVGPDCDHSEAHYESLRASFRRHFPQLGELEFPYAWGGPIASTTRFTPFFGALAGGRLLYGLGYTGHGVGTTRIAGKILAHLALEKRSELLDLSLVTKPPLPFPPRPLRAWAIERVTRDLRRVDEGATPSLLLRLLDRIGIGFSS